MKKLLTILLLVCLLSGMAFGRTGRIYYNFGITREDGNVESRSCLVTVYIGAGGSEITSTVYTDKTGSTAASLSAITNGQIGFWTAYNPVDVQVVRTNSDASTTTIRLLSLTPADHYIEVPRKQITLGNVSLGTVSRSGALTATGNATYGVSGTGIDAKWWGTTAGDFMFFNFSGDVFQFEDITLQMMDDTIQSWGDGDDVTMQYDENGNNELQFTGAVGFDNTVTFRGGQTRKHTLDGLGEVVPDGSNPPGTIGALGTNAQSLLWAWQFDGNGSNGDDLVFLRWNVPDGYVTDSLRLNIGWSFSDAETNDDDVVFDMTVLAVTPGTAAAGGDAWDAAGTAFTQGDTNLDAGAADNDKLIVTQLNPEVLTIAVNDTVIIMFWVDESESDLNASGTLDVHFFEMEWESTE